MTDYQQRFLSVMEYEPTDQVPNWEAGAWLQTRERWEEEAPETRRFHWNWFCGEEQLGMDPREFVTFNRTMIPPFEEVRLAEDDRTYTFRDVYGRIRRTLKDRGSGTMDTFVSFPVQTMADWQEIKRRYELSPRRYEANWSMFRAQGWRNRRHPLIFGQNTSTMGFYHFSRQLLGTLGLSFAFHDQPELVHDIMEFQADFLIEAARPILAETTIDYVCFAEDLAMHSGTLLSPATYRAFIYPRLARVIDYLKSHGVRYVCIDTDGNPEAVIPMMLDAGVDALWPLERAADQDPRRLRAKFGKSLRLWGGVDKRVLATAPSAIDEHLRTFRPLIEEGGFIPTVDHTVPPDVSWANFRHYMQSKAKLLRGEL